MFSRTLQVLRRCDALDRVIVLTQQPEFLEIAVQRGADAWREERQTSHSDSANAASERAAAEGVGRLLLCPIDVPLLDTAEVEAILTASRGLGSPSVVIAPSADDTGTNALVCSPPAAINARFGPNSRQLHETEAAKRRIPTSLYRSVAWRHDLDTPQDLERLIELGLSGEVREILDAIGAQDRLTQARCSDTPR